MNKLQEPVLVVDDEADIRDLMEMTLMKMGLRVDTAAGVEEAKDKLDNNDYSLVLTDMRMPDGSGLEVAAAVGSAWTPDLTAPGFRARRSAMIDALADACEASLDLDHLLELAQEAP